MSSITAITRAEAIELIIQAESKLMIDTTIQHVAIPMIAGMSMDDLSQEEYTNMGLPGRKPEPLPLSAKLDIYKKIHSFLKDKLSKVTKDFIQPKLNTLDALSDEAIKAKALSMEQRELPVNFKRFIELAQNHFILFSELESKSVLKFNVMQYHDLTCPIICKYRDSGQLFASLGPV